MRKHQSQLHICLSLYQLWWPYEFIKSRIQQWTSTLLVASWHQTPNATNVLFPTTLAKAQYHQLKVVDLCPESKIFAETRILTLNCVNLTSNTWPNDRKQMGRERRGKALLHCLQSEMYVTSWMVYKQHAAKLERCWQDLAKFSRLSCNFIIINNIRWQLKSKKRPLLQWVRWSQ